MNRFKKILRWILGGVLLLIGILGLFEFITQGYDPTNEGIMKYSDEFKNLFNSLMLSYVGVFIRIFHVIIGILLFTKKYWWIGLLIHLPIAFNIFLIHILYDIPTDQTVFFIIGIFVSLSTFLLVALEKEKLKALVTS